MVLGFALLAARLAAYGARAASGAVKVAKSPVGKVGIIGGAVGWAGLGVASATKEVEQSAKQGGTGLLYVGGIIAAVILVLIIIMRRK